MGVARIGESSLSITQRPGHLLDAANDDDDDDDDDGDDDDGYPAYSHHDKIPPWWGNVRNDEGGNVSVSKNHHTTYTMINHILEYICIR